MGQAALSPRPSRDGTWLYMVHYWFFMCSVTACISISIIVAVDRCLVRVQCLKMLFVRTSRYAVHTAVRLTTTALPYSIDVTDSRECMDRRDSKLGLE
jgi:hypothetical protein